jgi:hypothetical protein
VNPEVPLLDVDRVLEEDHQLGETGGLVGEIVEVREVAEDLRA